MEKIYTVRYTSAGTPKAKTPIVVGAGNLKSVAVPFPSEGFVTKLVVKQTSGTSVPFQVELLDSKIPFPVGEVAVATAPADDIEHYRIIDQQSASAGNAIAVIGEQPGFAFQNTDGTFTVNQRYIYLVIKPIGAAGSTTWDVTITCHRDSG